MKADRIRSMLLDGATYAQIIAETGAAKSTIHYHAKALGNPNSRNYDAQVALATESILSGKKNPDVIASSGLSERTVCKLRARLKVSGRTKSIEWETVQAFYDDGHTVRECMAVFDFSAGAWSKALQRGDINPRGETPIEMLLVENSTAPRGTVKRRLLEEGLIENRCSICKMLPEWMGAPLVLILDHINGVNNDNRRHNLRLLCPNCNAQTETFAGRNVIFKRRMLAEAA